MSARARYHEDGETSVQWSRRRRTAPIVRVREHRRPASTVLSVRRKAWACLRPEISRRFDREAMVPTVWRPLAHSPAQSHRSPRSTSRGLIWCSRMVRHRSISSHLNPSSRSSRTRQSKKRCKKVSYRLSFSILGTDNFQTIAIFLK